MSDLPFPIFFRGIPALEMYHQKTSSGLIRGITTASLIELAKEFDDVRFPSCDFADVLVRLPESSAEYSGGGFFDLAVMCSETPPDSSFFNASGIGVCNFIYDAASRKYKDPLGMYREIRDKSMVTFSLKTAADVIDSALLFGRLGYSLPREAKHGFYNSLRDFNDPSVWTNIPQIQQRYILTTLLAGASPQRGFKVLKESGFISALWPELTGLSQTVHAKEFHPEGDVWDHTMEVFKHRKTRDLRLSLGLLLHDVGKPKARKESGNAFNRHAQIGASIAARFLDRLGFDASLRADVCFLVTHHMLPPFISRLPLFRTEKVMSSPLFPLLLELFRCDLTSTYRSPDDYYAACKTYRKYLKNRRNPFRSAEGKKLLRLYVE